MSYFVARHGAVLGGVAAVQAAALCFLAAQAWPGNVRQLENVVKRMLLLAHGYAITAEVVQQALTQGPPGVPEAAVSQSLQAICGAALEKARREPSLGAIANVFGTVERELLAQAHATTAGNISQMARLLGWSRLTVREKLKFYGLRPDGP